jgi:hypothetical protein
VCPQVPGQPDGEGRANPKTVYDGHIIGGEVDIVMSVP